MSILLRNEFQANGGPGGLLSITYAGAPLAFSNDQVLTEQNGFNSYQCFNVSGCADKSEFQYFGGDNNPILNSAGGAPGATTYTEVVDSTWHDYTDYSCPGLCPPPPGAL